MSAEPYDLNFCFPIPPALENDRVKLVPFIPSIHSVPFFEASQETPEIYRYLPWGPFDSLEGFNDLTEKYFHQNEGWVLFAVYDKTKPNTTAAAGEGEGTLAGAMGYISTSFQNLCTEIGAVIILPAFQRTHVASNAVGLLLNYALNLPSTSPDDNGGGLGLRRVVWQANFLNKGSTRLASRMHFQFEGILRWDRVLPIGKDEASNGKPTRDGDLRPENVGRDTAIYSLCWDDWELKGAKEKVAGVMARVN